MFIQYLNTTITTATTGGNTSGSPILPLLQFHITDTASQNIITQSHTSAVSSASSVFSLYLEHLIVSNSSIRGESGAPFLYTSDSGSESDMRLCVLKGEEIHPGGSERYLLYYF